MLIPIPGTIAALCAALVPALWEAAGNGDVRNVRQLLAEEADIEEKWGPEQSTPLSEAALMGGSAVVKVLLEHGADASAKDTEGQQPIHYAVDGGDHDVTRLLLDHGADPSVKDNNGYTPLHAVAYAGELAILRMLLLENGVEIDARNNRGWTPLHEAAVDGREAVVLILLEHGAVVSPKTDRGGLTPLHIAAKCGHQTSARVLLDKGADLLSKTNAGHTAEDTATRHSHHQIAVMLKAEAEYRARCEAFAMGYQERLGVGSRVRWLDAEVARMVLEVI